MSTLNDLFSKQSGSQVAKQFFQTAETPATRVIRRLADDNIISMIHDSSVNHHALLPVRNAYHNN
jgi:hypothetical protein